MKGEDKGQWMHLFFHKSGNGKKEEREILATCTERIKGILWSMETEILKRKPILNKFRKLAKNWVKNRNTGDRSGKEIRKEMRTHL